jgi:hypothetical protein
MTCGASLFSIVDGSNEVEIRVGTFDTAPSDLFPSYELWINRREKWLRPIDGAEQHTGNRSGSEQKIVWGSGAQNWIVRLSQCTPLARPYLRDRRRRS